MSTMADSRVRTPDKWEALTEVLIVSLRDLADAGRADLACQHAGRACAAFRESDPMAWNRFNILLHRLSRHVA
jgi:hypothetical protein